MILTLLRSIFNPKQTQVKFLSISSSWYHARVIDGKAVAKAICDEVKYDVDVLISGGGRCPYLSVILVGDDPASHVYVRNKIKASTNVGINSNEIKLPSSISETELLNKIYELNTNDDVDGILVQLPLPPHINERRICNSVDPSKDVDGFGIINIGRFCVDQSAFVPATPSAVLEIIRRTGIPTFGKNAVVVGRSKNVGLPIAIYLNSDGRHDTQAGDATTTICHRYTPPQQLKAFTSAADIVVVAAGVPGLITADMIKPGAAVIDVGINRIVTDSGKTRLVGDVDFAGVKEKAGFITPVPGGVGPVTVAMLMKNTLLAYKREIDFSSN